MKDKLRSLHLHKNITQEALAKRLGITLLPRIAFYETHLEALSAD